MLIFLTAQLEGLLNQARRIANDLINKEDPHYTEYLDIAFFDEDKNRWIRIHNRESNLIKKIQTALRRIEEGQFNIYEDCGKEIPFNRLMDRPVTTRCIRCKTREELAERAAGFQPVGDGICLGSGDVMDTSLLRKIDLESGLELEIYDVSRKLAGDRWYVGFVARVEIPITFLAGHTDSPEVDIEKMKDVLGETVRFEQKRDRHYIDEKEKDTLLNGLIDDFLASTLPYFSEKDFAKKYALKEYKKKLKKASWYKT